MYISSNTNYTAVTAGTVNYLTDNGGIMDFVGPTDNSCIIFSPETNGDANWNWVDGTNPISLSFWTNVDSVAPSTGSTNAPIHLNLYGGGHRFFTTMGDGGVVDKIHMRGQIGGTWQSPVSSDTIETGK